MSFGEIILILILGLFVFGPKELPIIASKIATVVVKFRKLYLNLKDELYIKSGIQDIKQVKSDIDELYQDIQHNIGFKNNIEYNENYDGEFLHKVQLYYQPELDFEREPELFDYVELNNETRVNQ